MSEDLPFISVIIAAEPNKVPQKTIDSLLKIDYPKSNFEIFLAKGHNPSCQRNEAAKRAKGDILYFLDSDSVASPELFKNVIEYYKDDKTAAVGGPNIIPEDSGFIQKAFDIIHTSIFGYFSARARYFSMGKARSATEKELILCNLSFKRKIFDEFKGLNEDLFPNEENELMNKILGKGYKLIYNPLAYVYRERRKTVPAFIFQGFRYGKGRLEQIKSFPCFSDTVHMIPTLFIIYLLSLAFIRHAIYLLPLYLYILLSFIFSISGSIKKRNILLVFIAPFLFLLQHISYGTGFISGIIIKSKKRDKNVTVEKIEPV